MGAHFGYYHSRLVSVVFTGIGALGLGYQLMSDIGADSTSIIICSIFLTIGLVQWTRQSYRAKRNYAWYKTQHPECVVDRVKCHSCGSDRITLRHLMQHSYTRAHVCANCGTTLFYSPEA